MVNAKNSFGGYVGERFFMVNGEDVIFASDDGAEAFNQMDCCYALVSNANGALPEADRKARGASCRALSTPLELPPQG